MYLKFELCSDEGIALIAGVMPVRPQPWNFFWEAAPGNSIIERKKNQILHAFKLELTPLLGHIDLSDVGPFKPPALV